jgi:hypothetical protein
MLELPSFFDVAGWLKIMRENGYTNPALSLALVFLVEVGFLGFLMWRFWE